MPFFLQPTTLMLADASKGTNAPAETLKSLPAMYDASNVTVQQFFATSADGTCATTHPKTKHKTTHTKRAFSRAFSVTRPFAKTR
jgi:prolyl oligopeptidase PreP (S9A serine peptidase family)